MIHIAHDTYDTRGTYGAHGVVVAEHMDDTCDTSGSNRYDTRPTWYKHAQIFFFSSTSGTIRLQHAMFVSTMAYTSPAAHKRERTGDAELIPHITNSV